MAEKSIMIDIDDPRSGKIAEVLRNKTCKKILGLLAEDELSESDIASRLRIPLNTVGYNIKKLKESGLIESSKKFFWSQKGKKILLYKVSNKKIVISPKYNIKGIVPAVLVSLILAGAIKVFTASREMAVASLKTGSEDMALATDSAARTGSDYLYGGEFYSILANASNVWAWFLIGALLAIVVIVLWNWNKKIGGRK